MVFKHHHTTLDITEAIQRSVINIRKGLPDIKQVFIQPVRIMNRSPAGVLLPLTYWN